MRILTPRWKRSSPTKPRSSRWIWVSVESTSDADAKARAKALLKVLKQEGVANNNAKLVVRAADASERAEIFRSGFLLNQGMVLR